MNIKEEFHGDVVVLELKGNLMGDPETTNLREKVRSLVEDGFLKIVLDIAKLKWVNSSGLGSLISALATINNGGGDLRIANVTEKINSLFMITQLIKVFKSFDSVDRAIASFLVDPPSGTKAE
jgi:anti-sigma B factor antagonist